ncbi:MAG: phosphate/phosphite/phosphonate ABC transporter substrate-binding protein [Anaerolineales bacterium]|nr:phosphate/phosphite/phosphonate ABC transporter substrate-binding protein [Anaerolineales bacterium]
MWQKWLGWVVLGIGLCLLAGCEAQPEPTPEAAAPAVADRVLVLGDISDEPAETIRGTQPIADYLAAALRDLGVTRAEVVIAPDLETMTQLMADGQVDLYFDSPYPALVISQETGAVPILRRWKYGVSEYHSLFFARADAGLASLDDLQGQQVAFEESFSTSGYMLPLSYLIEHDYKPVMSPSLGAPVAADEIGYVFSTADNTTIQWVVSGRVPAGVVDNITYELFIPEETRAELVILAETEAVPRQMVLVRPGMEPALQAAIRETLLAIDEDEAGQAALETFLTTEFDEFPQGVEAALARMQTLYDLVQSP